MIGQPNFYLMLKLSTRNGIRARRVHIWNLNFKLTGVPVPVTRTAGAGEPRPGGPGAAITGIPRSKHAF